MKISGLFRVIKNTSIKYSPEIFAGLGCVGLVAAGVIACKKTLKITEIKEKKKDILNQIDEMEKNGLADENVEYTAEDAANDRRIVKVKTVLDYVKLYSIPVGIAIVSVGSIFWGHKILRKRNGALIAAYTAIDQSFKEYRKRVVGKFGSDVDRQLKFGTDIVEEKSKVKDEDGKTKTVTTKKEVINGPLRYSAYAIIYQDGCNGWSEDPEDSKEFLIRLEKIFTAKLRREGHLFLNDVYEALGVKKTKAGQIVGWIYKPEDPERDNYVSFNIFNNNSAASGRFVNGYEPNVIIDPNVDGPIIDLI